MTQPELNVIHNVNSHRFEVTLDGRLALAEYLLAPGRIIFSHTKVPPQHQGRGVAGTIIRAGLDYAREQGLEVVPLCPYVADYINRHPEYQSLVHSS